MTFSYAALYRQAAKHLENDILGGNPRLQPAGQIYFYHFGHINVISAAAHGHRHIQSARAHSQHTDAAAGGSVAVGADQGLAGNAEALQMNLMADAVSGTGKVNAVFFGHRLNKAVVVGVFKAGLQGVVVDIGHGLLGFDTRNAHSLKLQISHRSGSVLR